MLLHVGWAVLPPKHERQVHVPRVERHINYGCFSRVQASTFMVLANGDTFLLVPGGRLIQMVEKSRDA